MSYILFKNKDYTLYYLDTKYKNKTTPLIYYDNDYITYKPGIYDGLEPFECV